MTDRSAPCVFFKRIFLLLFIFSNLFCFRATAQIKPPGNEFNQSRFRGIVIAESAITAIGLIGLNYLWYKKFPRSRFHLFNDGNEWLNMDKVGHATTAYNMSNLQYNMMRSSGVNNNQSIWIAGLTALGFQTIIEIFDGFSKKWGFSVTDMIANVVGTTLFMSQQFAFNEQRVQLKFSFRKTIYPSYYPAELGKNKWQSWLKDYNGQTYWLTINPSTFMKTNTTFPKWLNASIGYGAEGMIGANKNPTVINGKEIPYYKRYRQYYISMDADLSRMDMNNTSPKALLSLPRLIKFPFPAIELSKHAPVKYNWLYF